MAFFFFKGCRERSLPSHPCNHFFISSGARYVIGCLNFEQSAAGSFEFFLNKVKQESKPLPSFPSHSCCSSKFCSPFFVACDKPRRKCALQKRNSRPASSGKSSLFTSLSFFPKLFIVAALSVIVATVWLNV